MGSKAKTLLLFGILISLILGTSQIVGAQKIIEGTVQDGTGKGIPGANVAAWFDDKLVASTVTDSEGEFQIAGEKIHVITVHADIEGTPGLDFLPALKETDNQTGIIEFHLLPAATIAIDGDIQFIDSEELPLSVIYSVIDDVNETLSPTGYPLRYGSKTGYPPHSSIYLEERTIIVPVGRNLIEVNTTILSGNQVLTRTFKFQGPELEQGSKTNIDIREFLISANIDIVEEIKEKSSQRLEEMDELGFFLAKQRGLFSSGMKWLIESRDLYQIREYTQSFDAAKRSFIDFRKTHQELESLYKDASSSVYILLVFLALTGISIAQLMTNSFSTKLASSVAIYSIIMAVMYYVYPGSVTIPFRNFLGAGLISLIASLGVSLFLPMVLKGRRNRDGHVPVRNIIIPIFSLAKRSLNRRNLRFFLTLISITVLVMSFVSLTSFSEGYGLIMNKVSSNPGGEGLLLRESSWTLDEISFIPYKENDLEWLERQEEIQLVSPKFENLPQLRSIYALNDQAIMGVIGMNPTTESEIIQLEAVLVEGVLPSENGIMISRRLQKDLDVILGDLLSLGNYDLQLQGIFDDGSMQKLMDFDGNNYLPKKIVNQNPEGEIPILVEEICSPNEVAIVHLSKAKDMPILGISRIDVKPAPTANVNELAERLALERGFKVWASTSNGIHLAQLSNYLEGKGLPLIIPWAIVVLNVVITMLNSLFERRKEIGILSSVGLNPAQISGIFVAEAMIIGLIGGGAGYLLGLGLYKGMAYIGATLEVHQKISAFWSLASIGLSISAVLTGAMAALKSSVVITPSLMRRWRIDRNQTHFNEPWRMEIPVKLLPREKSEFQNFALDFLEDLKNHPLKVTSQIKLREDEATRIDFIYRSAQSTGENFYTKNSVIIQSEDGIYNVKLESLGELNWVHQVGSMVRMMAMEWSTRRG
jgi:ABC-type lipoprotein release transport system permease subunit